MFKKFASFYYSLTTNEKWVLSATMLIAYFIAAISTVIGIIGTLYILEQMQVITFAGDTLPIAINSLLKNNLIVFVVIYPIIIVGVFRLAFFFMAKFSNLRKVNI